MFSEYIRFTCVSGQAPGKKADIRSSGLKSKGSSKMQFM